MKPIYLHVAGAIEVKVAQAAAKEMADKFKAAGAGLAMISFFDQPAPPECSRPSFAPGPAVKKLEQEIGKVFAAKLPKQHGAQTFTTLTVNRNWATEFHRDTGTRPGSIVALVIVKIGDVQCPTVLKEPAEVIEMESGDLLLFQGAEIEHGNPNGLAGKGTRWAFVFYSR